MSCENTNNVVATVVLARLSLPFVNTYCLEKP
jgi:hypothetical protein